MGLGEKILKRMYEVGIKTRKELAEKMNSTVHPYTVGKWISGKSVPHGSNLIALARALHIDAELLVLDDSSSAQKTKSLERMVVSIVEREAKRILADDKTTVDSEINRFLDSERVPEEDKKSILRQVRNLLKMYDNDGDSKSKGGE